MKPEDLTKQQEHFAQLCVSLCNASAAYRQAYDVGKVGSNFRTIHAQASQLLAKPHVAARVQQLRDEAAAASAVPSLATRIAELREIEIADPRELCGIRRVNCRYCHGEGYKFQWVDEAEYGHAYDAALRAKQPLPDLSGGFGFHGLAEPAPECPKCYGEGSAAPYVTDVTKITSSARRLYKGVKIKGNGDIEILMHDQLAARDQLNRIMGAYKDGAGRQGVNLPSSEEAAVRPDANDEEAARGYLQMVAR